MFSILVVKGGGGFATDPLEGGSLWLYVMDCEAVLKGEMKLEGSKPDGSRSFGANAVGGLGVEVVMVILCSYPYLRQVVCVQTKSEE
jgi:hypothetical protein